MKQPYQDMFYESEITVQARDAVTGKVVQEAKGTNFAGNQAIQYAKYAQRAQYFRDLPSGSKSLDPSPVNPTPGLFLTDSTKDPDPANEWVMPGALIGYSLKSDFGGTDIWRGAPVTPNLKAEFDKNAGNYYAKWQFSWPTSSAIGQINSVGWGSVHMASVSAPSGYGSHILTKSTRITKLSSTGAGSSPLLYFARKTDGSASYSVNGTNTTTIYTYNANYSRTGFIPANINSGFQYVRGIAWDNSVPGGQLWVIGTKASAPSQYQIAAIDPLTGFVNVKFDTQTNRPYQYLAYDGTNLWTMVPNAEPNTAVTLYSIAVGNGGSTPGNDVAPITFNTANIANNGSSSGGVDLACGLCWDPDQARLWVRTYCTRQNLNHPGIYGLDRSGRFSAVNISANADVSLAGDNIGQIGYDTNLHAASDTQADFDIVDASTFAAPAAAPNGGTNTQVQILRASSLGTRTKLTTDAVNKTNTQTLNVIYTVRYI